MEIWLFAILAVTVVAAVRIHKNIHELSKQTTQLRYELQDLKTEVQGLKDRTGNVARKKEHLGWGLIVERDD